MQNIARPEHPFPQMERKNWTNLNGEWQFEFDFGKSGRNRKLYEQKTLKQNIIVPFCPESELSGINYKDFIPAVWYKRTIEISKENLKGRTLLHFGAVDYESYVYINGKEVGTHKGGYSSFEFDITEFLVEGSNDVTLYVEDDVRSGLQPRGKQSCNFYSVGCDYTRTTGIWQTVWLEFVPSQYIKSVKYYPNIEEGSLHISAIVEGSGKFTAIASFGGVPCGEVATHVRYSNVNVTIKLDKVYLWEAGKGNLYDLVMTFEKDTVYDIEQKVEKDTLYDIDLKDEKDDLYDQDQKAQKDTVKSYFGLREVKLDGMKFLINGKSVFQRLVLDQGFYPEGIYTAPTEEALVKDIQLSIDMGFNGARLHQKVFEPRYLYHCDRMGYLVWGEHASWGLDISNLTGLKSFLPEWLTIVERDFNHPSIIGWCPFNETWDYDGRQQIDDIVRIVYNTTKQFDTTRPCIDTSGNYHVITDIYDLHNYVQDVEQFKEYYEALQTGGEFKDDHKHRQTYSQGLPVFISEYGGIKWDPNTSIDEGWGYGEAPKTEEEFISRYDGLTTTLLDNPNIFGFCYTQLYDVEQEVNGLYYYNRTTKFNPAIIKAINEKKAAIES